MKKRFVDPFTPNRPIDDPTRFIGREDAVDTLIDSVYQTMSGNPRHTIITGERGVGKSSLLMQIYLSTRGDNRLTDIHEIDKGKERYDFLSVWHDVDSNQGVDELALGIVSKFDSDFKRLFKGVKLEIGIDGFIKISREKQSKTSIAAYVEEFTARIKTIHDKAIENGKDGVLVFIDELDRVKTDSGVSSFFKLSTEKLARDGVKRFAFISAGITGAVQNLEEEHASIFRTFLDVPLDVFAAEEVGNLLADGFSLASYRCDISQIQEKAHQVTVGIPEPIHLLGSAMLAVDTDGDLTQEDILSAIERIITVERKSKLSQLLKSAGGGKYQKIIEAMSQHEQKIVPLEFIAQKIKQEQSQFSTNMATLVKREVIFKPTIGYYAFCDPMLKEYVRKYGVISLEE